MARRTPRAHYDAIIVGAGFGGLHMLHRLRGLGLTVRLFDAADQVGGTWFWNRYPGARCDFESHDYSYEFDDQLQQDWTWSERYPAQPEILRYLNHVADRFDLRTDIQLRTKVTSAQYADDTESWTVGTEGDDHTETASAQFLIMATGALSLPRLPDFPGIDRFAGRWYHTANWPHESVDFTGKKVAVIGTGSSGVQVIPRIAQQSEYLYVLQRTAGFIVPAHNRPLSLDEDDAIKSDYQAYRDRARESYLGVHFPTEDVSALEATPDEHTAAYEARWQAGGSAILATYPDLPTDVRANDTLADFVRSKIAELVVDDDTAKLLTPQGFPIGSKRLVVDTEYYPTFNRDTVELIDVRADPIEEITETGIRTSNTEYNVDAIVFATGFDALTGPLLNIDIRGTNGRTLTDKWSAGPTTYLGLAIAGFPNLFSIAGPGSPSVLSNVVRSTEQHVEWIAELLQHMREHGYRAIAATPDAEQRWVDDVNDVAAATVLTSANSWYLGANVPGKPRVFMPYAGGVPEYRRICDDIAADNYRGFVLS
ncbi:NAD(P)/FAD-dependent oxidoreductase (plasmid) [Rhodococcus opacus]|uniref:flavin-containing monooxygenase n=1 Tax=Rhodococcus opacus TaxID=37919 RepID=UPI001C9DC747|nr:NAD(P)/FAD-dependent oxidoreductase [Rhodococcus opacus]QZS52501.1 NAD(P)/FAD-dependent oxidoreductase [Rhodococcus opacus]